MTVNVNLNDRLEVCSFDDLQVRVVDGSSSLQCPVCGMLAVPRQAPTLSDFTNAALDHLADAHRDTSSRVH
jgi:uncharacterized C2H2 Zn-finger protein